MAGNDIIRVSQLRAYQEAEKTEPTMFLSSFFKEPEGSVYDTEEVEIDSERTTELVATDVVPGAGGNLNENGRFVNKNYVPPLYDEFVAVDAFSQFKRLPGENIYNSSMSGVARAMARILRGQIECRRKIQRAIEKQAVDIFFSAGVLTWTFPIRGAGTLDYEHRTELDYTATVTWATSTTNILGDIELVCDRIRQYGHTTPKKLIAGKTAWQYMQANDEWKARLDQRWRTTDMVEFANKDNGAIYHGTVTVNNYALEVWTYPQGYVNAAGTFTKYIPDEKVLILDPDARFEKAFGGVPAWQSFEAADQQLYGLDGIPVLQAGRIMPYFRVDKDKQAVYAGVRSRPLCIPVAIDSYATIDVTP